MSTDHHLKTAGFSSKVKELKITIKRWEAGFSKEHNRKPTKSDIRTSAPAEIQKNYRRYWKLLLQDSAQSKPGSGTSPQDEIWGTKFNKSKNNELGNDGQKPSGFKDREHNVMKNCINKLRAQVLSSKNFLKLPARPVLKQGENCHINSNVDIGENAQTKDHVVEFTKWNVPTKCLSIRDEVLHNNTVRRSNTFYNEGKATGTKSKVDIGWLSRCSEDLTTLSDAGWTTEFKTRSYEAEEKDDEASRSSYILQDDKANSRITCTESTYSISPHNSSTTIPTRICETEKRAIEMPKSSSVFQEETVVACATYSKLTVLVSPQKSSEKIIPKPIESDVFTFIDEPIQLKNEVASDSEFAIKHSLSNKTCPTVSNNDNAIVPRTENLEQDGTNHSSLPFDVFSSSFETAVQANVETSNKKSKQIKNRKRKRSENGDPPFAKAKRPSCSGNAYDPIRNSEKPSEAKSKQNYVRINLKKKVFVRGKRNFSYKKYKREKWKNYQKNRNGSNSSQLQTSLHKTSGRKEIWDPSDLKKDHKLMENEEENLPTLEEATAIIKEATTRSESNNGTKDDSESETPKPFGVFQTTIFDSTPIEPLYELSCGKVIQTPREVFDALNSIGFDNFRPGQEKAIMRILSGLSALVVLPTGTGKSLCYQLPAFMYGRMYRCISLVISPLVSLMEDQVANVPSCLKAVCWHSGLPEAQKTLTLERLATGEVNILLISPETLVSGSGYLFGKLPPVAFVCIDEAHCLSEWSHNFRPSYLQLIKVLTTKMGVTRILALTATASKATTNGIASHLGLTGEEGAVIVITGIPDNLLLSVSRDEFRDEALVQLLRGERFRACDSIIIYCTRREETERISSTIRICMQGEELSANEGRKGKCKQRWLVDAYHGGLTAAKRKSVQKRFMTGSLRIVVATVAFGMGLNKIDVRGIIHYNMPRTFEHYVQEIGRSGRDGLPAHCHLFLNVDGKDLPELQRHIYGNSVDRHTIRKLLTLLFKPCRCVKLYEESTDIIQCPGHEMAIPIGDIVNKLDVREENIATLICYLECLPEKWIHLLQPVYAKCTLRCYKGQSQLLGLVKSCPPVAVAFALARKNGEKPETHLQFDVVIVASHMGWDSGVVKKQLKQLEWEMICGRWKKTGVMVEFSDLAFHLKTTGNLSDDQKDRLLDYLHEKVSSMEKRELLRIAEVESTFNKVSHAKYESCCDEVDLDKSRVLKKEVMKYYDRPILEFDESENETMEDPPPKNNLAEMVNAVKDIRSLLDVHHDNNFTGRAVARIFHGIGSPCYPVEVWGRVRRFWRSHMHVDFNQLITLANEEVRKVR